MEDALGERCLASERSRCPGSQRGGLQVPGAHCGCASSCRARGGIWGSTRGSQPPPQALGRGWAEPAAPAARAPLAGLLTQGREQELLLPNASRNPRGICSAVECSAGVGSRGASESGAAWKSRQISLSFLASAKTLRCWSGSGEGQRR